jgi:hypothetical protein
MLRNIREGCLLSFLLPGLAEYLVRMSQFIISFEFDQCVSISNVMSHCGIYWVSSGGVFLAPHDALPNPALYVVSNPNLVECIWLGSTFVELSVEDSAEGKHV